MVIKYAQTHTYTNVETRFVNIHLMCQETFRWARRAARSRTGWERIEKP
jgi:hypothetical protein